MGVDEAVEFSGGDCPESVRSGMVAGVDELAKIGGSSAGSGSRILDGEEGTEIGSVRSRALDVAFDGPNARRLLAVVCGPRAVRRSKRSESHLGTYRAMIRHTTKPTAAAITVA